MIKDKGKAINESLKLGGKYNLFSKTGDFYQVLKEFPGILFDKNGYIKFETKEKYKSCSHLKINEKIHIVDNNNIKSIPGYTLFNEEDLYNVNQILSEDADFKEKNSTNDQAERRPRLVDSIVRNQTLVRKVKEIRDNTCQICETKLQLGPNSFYSEVHHLQPLGKPHNGEDIIGNMICVCPNCHKN